MIFSAERNSDSMAALSSPRGLIVDLLTPLKQNGDIDGRSLGRQLDRVLPHVQAVLIAGPYLGEGGNLSAAQRAELLEKTLVVIRGRLPVLVWITQDTEQETRETLGLLSKTLKTRKYKGQVCWLDTPLYYHSNRGLVSYYRNVTTLTRESWLLHNDPGLIDQLARSFKRNNIRTAILKEILEIEEIRGLLFLGSLDRAGNYQKATRARPDFRIYDGDELRFLTHPSLSGVVSAGANLSPKAWSKITEASLGLSDAREDYPDRLQQIWIAGQHLRTLLDLYSSKTVHVIKQVLSEAGILESPTCTVQAEEVGEEVRSIIEEMKKFGDYTQ
jgi:dihydrodipicolinate synthase/N-acetylneuraminate lyase